MLQYGIPEIPERISVETCFIGREAARLQNIEAVDISNITLINQNSSVNVAIATTDVANSSTSPKELLPIKVYTDSEMNTDSPNPMRDRTIQTETSKHVSIGIQCNVEEELCEAELKKALKDLEASQENFDDLRKLFIEYVKDKTRRLKDGKFECVLCGEIQQRPKLIAAHMAIHWGPPKLCAGCGVQFEHSALCKDHLCTSKRSKKRYFIKCPHYSCGVYAISPAELYDHLNEHCGLLPHRCSNCKKGFATSGELHFHRKLHKKCANAPVYDIYQLPKEDTMQRRRVLILKTPQGRKVVVKFFLSQVARQTNGSSRNCTVCLKRCKNAVHHQKHGKKCLKQHQRRLKHKRDVISQKSTTNGYAVNGI